MEIQKWLQSNKDYSQGIVLLKKYSKNKVLLRNLSRNKNLSKLIYELNKLGEKQLREKKVQKAKPKKRVVLPPDPNKIIVDKAVIEHRGKRLMQDYPTQLHEVYKLAVRLHYEWLSLKLELVELPAHKVSDALVIQKQMFYIRKENQRCWDKLKYFEKTGEILLDKVLLPLNNMTDLQKLKKLKNLRSSYSKRKKTLEKWMEVGADHTKIMKKKNEMRVIKDQIKLLENATKS